MQKLILGRKVIALIDIHFQSMIPLLLLGQHGIGKSEIFIQAARFLGIDYRIIDLSVMEPPDLIGLPHFGPDGRSRYALPTWFPFDGRGIIVLEELNRCPRYIQAPCLQFLSARRIHDYVLPEGWLICAAINDSSGAYHVEALDDAMLSRFTKVEVVAQVEEWARWAASNGVHPRVIDFVAASPKVFDDPEANPRSWWMVSRFLKVWEGNGRDPELLLHALAGTVGPKWALAFLKAYNDRTMPLSPRDVVEEYPASRPAILNWIESRRLDLVAATINRLKSHLEPQAVYEEVIANEAWKRNVEAFFSDLPAELKRQVKNWLSDRGFGRLSVRRGRRRP